MSPAVARPRDTPGQVAQRLSSHKRHGFALTQAGERLLPSLPTEVPRRGSSDKEAYERYLLNCSDYLKRQMMIYEHWPQRKYDVLGYRKEKVFTDMNA